MNIYEHFSCHTKLPIRLKDIKDHVLDTGMVDRIIRIPVTLDHYIVHGGYHQYRELGAYGNRTVARIAYPQNASQGLQRLVSVKEMLHILDPHEATSPTKAKVQELISDLIVENAEKAIGLPAEYDHNGLLHALCLLLPRDSLDLLRPAYKREDKPIAQIAAEARIPESYVKIALTDSWRKLIDTL